MPKHQTKGGLTRETAYLYDDEDGALEERAHTERCSKSEVIRRALRQYLGIEGGEAEASMSGPPAHRERSRARFQRSTDR